MTNYYRKQCYIFFIIYFLFSFCILIKSKYITSGENIYFLFELNRFEKDKIQLISTQWEIFYYQFRYFTCSNLKLNAISLPFIFPVLLYGCIYKSEHRIKLDHESIQHLLKALLSGVFIIFFISLYLYSGRFDFVDSRGFTVSKNRPEYATLIVYFFFNLVLVSSGFLMLLAIARYVKFVLGLNPSTASSSD